jgi:hypothetical protein
MAGMTLSPTCNSTPRISKSSFMDRGTTITGLNQRSSSSTATVPGA